MTDKQLKAQEMHAFFKRVWDKSEDENGSCYCYETRRELSYKHFRQNTCCYHHILPKNRYPEYALEEWNIVILHPDVHEQVEKDISKCPRVEKLTKETEWKYLKKNM